MKISARNQLKGTVKEIKEGAVNANVLVDIGNGNIITSTISIAAVKDLDIKEGSEVVAIIKATSVIIGA